MTRGMLGCLFVLLCAAGAAPGQAPKAPRYSVGIEEPSPKEESSAASDEGEKEAGGEPKEVEPEDEVEAAVGPGYRFWAKGEFLQWWIHHASSPYLLTTTHSATDPVPGALGMPGTQPLLGGPRQDYGGRQGGRFTLGMLLGDTGDFGVEGSYLFLAARSLEGSDSAGSAPGSRVLARPFLNAVTGQQDASLVAFPGLIGGGVAVSSASFLQGAEADATALLARDSRYDVEALAGFHFVQLDENLYVNESDQVTVQSQGFPLSSIQVNDHFSTRNYFYGGQAGLRGRFYLGRWSLELLAKLALGDTHQIADVGGSTAISTQGQPGRLLNGGLLALPSNSGHFSRDVFGVVPEAGLNVAYRFTEHLRGFAGYTFLYWSDVARPGDQVDAVLNVNQVPTSLSAGAGGPARPAFAFHGNEFWAHGVSFGLEVRY